MAENEQLAEPNSHGLRWPAWALSVAAHLAVAVLGALLVTAEIRSRDTAAGDRPAGIVLVKHGADSNQVRYFSEQDAYSGATSAAGHSIAPGDASGRGDDPLFGAAPPDAGIKLPDLPGGLLLGEGLVPAVAPNAGSGRRPKLPFATIDEAAVLAADALIPREQQPTGPKATMSLFGTTAEGRSFVFAIDHSQSMGGDGLGAISAAAKELAKQVTSLTEEQKFQVVSYNQSATFFTTRELIPATGENKDSLVRFVANLVAAGPTEHERGLRAALSLKPEVIYLLTDGGDPHLKPAQIAAIVEQAGTRTTIHCLHFGKTKSDAGANDHFLRRLAAATGGNYAFVPMVGR